MGAAPCSRRTSIPAIRGSSRTCWLRDALKKPRIGAGNRACRAHADRTKIRRGANAAPLFLPAALNPLSGGALTECQRTASPRVILQPVQAKCLRLGTRSLSFFNAQFRTCLWPCVGRWASGQEAGQPPKEENTTSLLPRPAAGGETGDARSPRATRLKATTEGLFWLLPARMPGTPKGLVLLCQQCGTGLPPNPDRGNKHGDADAPRNA